MYKDSTTVNRCDYVNDYIVVSPTVIRAPQVKCDRGDYISMEDLSSRKKDWGYVCGIERTDDVTEISVMPFLGKMDVDVYKDREDLKHMTCERFLAELIRLAYAGDDVEQNIPGLEIIAETGTEGALLNLKDNVHNIYDVALAALKKYHITITFDIKVREKRVYAKIRRATEKCATVEADLSCVTDVSVNLVDTYEMVNKVTIYGSYQETHEKYGTVETVTYYLEPGGTVTMDPQERITPVVWTIKQIEINDDFEAEAWEVAYDTLYREEVDNNIELCVEKSGGMIDPAQFEVGQSVCVIYQGSQYATIYTGYEMSGDKAKMIFGAIRTEYTKKSRINRRLQNGN
ncbi:MAG: hypothetical protein K2N01_13375 [Lachnospiraceae bacterium]|nr:hypothetical protein [Lachnospiraceae bacterium]